MLSGKKLSVRAGVGIASEVKRRIRGVVPVGCEGLRNYLRVYAGVDVPGRRICEGHVSPMDYLCYVFGRDFGWGSESAASGDCVVWANRGGGKTQLGALATVLDCVLKPGCQVRILGGSFDQASRMYEYICRFVQEGFEDMLAEPVRKSYCAFANGSRVEVLTQSSRSVRGRHVQKLRCDEIELFDEDVLRAAHFVTQSSGGIVGGMEMISTMHRPYGLMHEAVQGSESVSRPVFRWCLWEVIEKCRDRSCSRCELNEDCQGKAKEAEGYFKIDDAISAMRRSSRAGWESEMLCIRPSRDNAVFGDFDVSRHVGAAGYESSRALYRAIDFGFVNPFVCLWIQVDDDGRVFVIDEYVRRRASIAVHADEIRERTPCGEESVAGTFCDPAGAGVNDVTGTSAVRELRSMGIRVRYRRSRILEGVELIRQVLLTGEGHSRLVISPRCRGLIEAMSCYHYPDGKAARSAELPEKDGVYDHFIDALRYFFVNWRIGYTLGVRQY